MNIPNTVEKLLFENTVSFIVFTGESHYYIFAEAPDQIRSINSKRAADITEEFCTKYNRRTSLMKMISGFEK